MTVDQVKLPEYILPSKSINRTKLGSTRHQVDLAHCYSKKTDYTEIVPRSTMS